jgi:hypothetical protein
MFKSTTKLFGGRSFTCNPRSLAVTRRAHLNLDKLEDRLVPSATPTFVPLDKVALPTTGPEQAVHASADATSNNPLFTLPWFTTDTVYSPNQIRTAYGFSNTKLDGKGQTIAIVVAYDETTIQSDLQTFDRLYSLKDAPALNVYKQWSDGAFLPAGTSDPYASAPSEDDDWAREAAMDVEWAHAIAQGATIDLVEAHDSTSLYTAVNFAKALPGVTVVSMSWGHSDYSGEATNDGVFTQPGVTFISGTGDSAGTVDYPSSSPNVLAVGGTTLTLGNNNRYGSETAWSDGGGGVSAYETVPAYQTHVHTYANRTVPDVAYNASSDTRYQVYCEAASGFWTSPGFAMYGVSAGVPQWAGLIALVNQNRANTGRAPLNNAIQDLYKLPAGDFHDIVDGNNSHWAHAGYDLATGLGTPKATAIIAGLLKAEPTIKVSGVLLSRLGSVTKLVGGLNVTVSPILAAAAATDGTMLLPLAGASGLPQNLPGLSANRAATLDKVSLIGHGLENLQGAGTPSGTDLDSLAGWSIGRWLNN